MLTTTWKEPRINCLASYIQEQTDQHSCLFPHHLYSHLLIRTIIPNLAHSNQSTKNPHKNVEANLWIFRFLRFVQRLHSIRNHLPRYEQPGIFPFFLVISSHLLLIKVFHWRETLTIIALSPLVRHTTTVTAVSDRKLSSYRATPRNSHHKRICL